MEPSNVLRFAVQDRINNVEVGPEHVPLSLLGEFQRDVSDFLRGSARELDPTEVMISIESGSLMIVATGLLAATTLWGDLDRLNQPGSLGLIDPKRAAVVERWQAAARKHPHRSYRLADDFQRVGVVIDSATNFHSIHNLASLAFEAHQPRFDEVEFAALVEKGTAAWSDVPNATEWLETLRGGRADDVGRRTTLHHGMSLAMT